MYINLYELVITKPITLYQNPFSITPEIEDGDIRIRQTISKFISKRINQIYGEYFISGNSLYCTKKINEAQTIKCQLYVNRRIEYILDINKYQQEKTINQEDIYKDRLTKQFIELIIRDILNANPNLESFEGFYFLKNKKQRIEIDNVSLQCYPGFTISFIETDSGNYLNIVLKNKIIKNETILDYINQYQYKNNKENQIEIKKKLIGKSFKVSYAKRNYKIDDILFDRNPKNQVIYYEGETNNLIKYYEIAHSLIIKDQDQPIIVVRRKDSQGQSINYYFIPELCRLVGLDMEITKDGNLMRVINRFGNLNSNERAKKTNEMIKLLVDPTKDILNPQKKLSAKEKSELYGIEVRPFVKDFRGYYMEETKLIGGKNKEVNYKDKTFPVYKKADMSNWLCFYTNYNYNSAQILINTLIKASKAFNLNIAKPKLIKMPIKSSAKDWIDTADDYLKKDKNKYNFILFLLGKNEDIYSQLKKHSLYNNNYISQVVKINTLHKEKILMSICSKILLQINNKLGGKSYILSSDEFLKGKKLMIIGVDSSHITNKRTGVAMVATISNTFDEFYNKEEIIEEEKNKQHIQFFISSFIEQVIEVYKRFNKEYPKGIIIYRQGVSLQEKDFLKCEIKNIELVCSIKNISYYYILVNKKENFKFFEKRRETYSNPDTGLLILDGITSKNYFEFYIQPQEITKGSSVPICYHVAHGNLNMHDTIPKLTFDLCNLYSNWNGKVRVPNVLKLAEKLSKITAKYMPNNIKSEQRFDQLYI